MVSDDPVLTLPHPRAHQRAFVLAPWNDVDPEAEFPGHGPFARCWTEWADTAYRPARTWNSACPNSR